MKPRDLITIMNILEKLRKVKSNIKELEFNISEHTDALSLSNRLHLKTGLHFNHEANQEALKCLSSVKSTVVKTLELHEKAKERALQIFLLREMH